MLLIMFDFELKSLREYVGFQVYFCRMFISRNLGKCLNPRETSKPCMHILYFLEWRDKCISAVYLSWNSILSSEHMILFSDHLQYGVELLFSTYGKIKIWVTKYGWKSTKCTLVIKKFLSGVINEQNITRVYIYIFEIKLK